MTEQSGLHTLNKNYWKLARAAFLFTVLAVSLRHAMITHLQNSNHEWIYLYSNDCVPVCKNLLPTMRNHTIKLDLESFIIVILIFQ